MKRIIPLFTVAILVTCACGCSEKGTDNNSPKSSENDSSISELSEGSVYSEDFSAFGMSLKINPDWDIKYTGGHKVSFMSEGEECACISYGELARSFDSTKDYAKSVEGSYFITNSNGTELCKHELDNGVVIYTIIDEESHDHDICLSVVDVTDIEDLFDTITTCSYTEPDIEDSDYQFVDYEKLSLLIPNRWLVGDEGNFSKSRYADENGEIFTIYEEKDNSYSDRDDFLKNHPYADEGEELYLIDYSALKIFRENTISYDLWVDDYIYYIECPAENEKIIDRLLMFDSRIG